MSRRPSVSVALTTYNGMKYVAQQIDSIMAQSYLPDEIVICDDASADATVEQLNQIQQQYPGRLRVYRNDANLGVTLNFQKVISLCQGEIIFLSDQDDFWMPEKVEKIIGVFSKNPQCGLVFSDAVVTDQTLKSQGFTVYSNYTKPDVSAERVLATFARQIQVLGCTCAFRAKYLPYFPPISPLWGHDHWIIFILAVISQLEMVDEPLMFYRRHDQNAGNVGAWDRNPLTNTIRKSKRLSKEYYQESYMRWETMLEHLTGLETKAAGELSLSAIRDGIAIVKARLAFEEHRLTMRNSPRLWRLIPALRSYRNGDYDKYSLGSRQFIKDLIA